MPAALQVTLLSRAMAAEADVGVACDVLVDFPRSAGQLSSLERAAGKVLCAVHVQGVGGSTSERLGRPR